MEITKNLQTIERSLKQIKKVEFRINKLWQEISSNKNTASAAYAIESMEMQGAIKKALAAVDAIKAEEFKFLNGNILPLICEQIGTDDRQK